MPDDPDAVTPPTPWWWDENTFVGVGQRVLIVTDGVLSYDPAADFGLSRFVRELAALVPTPTITRAHRGTCATADVDRFRFDTADPPVTTDHYDQIWLFGYEAQPVTPYLGSTFAAEVRVLTVFMNDGGGVFATGDHLTMGFGLCGGLPRIRQMRDWSSSPMTDERIDTVTNPGPDLRTQFDDQSDDVPQRIFPHYYGKGHSWAAHPILCGPLGDIDVLPDHPHESRCHAGTNLDATYQLDGDQLPEFPVSHGEPLVPEVIAWSVSAGRYLNPPGSIVGKPPTTPMIFGAISVWDGHQVRHGRIVCDATWHHFVNMNLDGTGAKGAPGNSRVGLRDPLTLEFTQDFHQIAEYYRNIARWLIPAQHRWDHWVTELVIERYAFPLAEEWRPLPERSSWGRRVQLGTLVAEALAAHHGVGFTPQLVGEALTLAGLDDVAQLVTPIPTGRPDPTPATLIDVEDLRRGVVGTIFDALVADLPLNPGELDEALGRKPRGHVLAKRVAVATGEALDAAISHYVAAAEHTITVLHRAGPSPLKLPLAPTTTNLVVTPNPALVGQPVTLTATVSEAAAGVPAGGVTFRDGAMMLGGAALDYDRRAILTAHLQPGSHSLTATYEGDPFFAPSTSPAVTVGMNKATTTTGLVVTPNPAVVGQTVTLTATVSESAAGVPMGPVTFRDGAMMLGGAALDYDRRAILTAQLPPGSHSLTATYEGDPAFAGSTSPPVTVAMNKAKTTTGLVVTPNPAVIGQTLMLTATVSESAAGVPAGGITFRDGAVMLGGAALDYDRRAILTAQLPPGSHSLTATYEGDPAFAPSTSPAVTVTMTPSA